MEGQMDQPSRRACPKCGSGEYTFRNRKQIEATADSPAQLETKFRCRACEYEFKERVDGVLKKAPPRE